MNPQNLYRILTNRKYLLGLFLLVSSYLQAQKPVASFIASSTEGCIGLKVDFTDQSTGNPTTWVWDLGNGTPVDTINKNPSTIYLTPGTYPVKLTVGNANGNDDTTIYITIFDKPKPDFTVSSKSGCAPFSTSFTDLSIAQPGDDIVKWDWNFSDGTATGQNPKHTFLKPGTFNVTLTTTSLHGCSNSKGYSPYITVYDPIIVNFGFSFVGGKSCKPPQTIQFAGSATTGPGTLTYSWNFGDSTNSSPFGASAFIFHQYQVGGNFSPTLIVKNNLGCIDSLTRINELQINNIKSTIAGPDTVCVSTPVDFSNSSNPLPSNYYWDLGNDFVSNAPVRKTFDTIGNYTIKMISSYGACTDTALKKISVIGPPAIILKADDSASCKVPFTVNFTDLTPGANKWQWDFGDGSGFSSSMNPSYTYTNLPAGGVDTVKLIVTDTHGCQSEKPSIYLIRIQEPIIKFSTAEGGGCIPYLFKPIADISGVVDGVKSYLWDFGTTPASTSTDAAPSFTYTALGSYDIKLTVNTNDGCVATSVVTGGVKIGTKPSADFNAVSTKACGGNDIQFTDLTTPGLSKPDDKWLWDFGDDSTSAEQNPTHAFRDTGKFNVKLIAWNDGCPDTLTKTNYITIDPAVAKFKITYDCIDKKTVSFTDSSILPITWNWDFGDGSAPSNQKSQTHTFPQYQSYPVTLTVTNGSCTDKITQVINLINEMPDYISSKDSICKSGSISFTATNINPENIKNYIWEFGDGQTDTTNTGTSLHQYDSAGIFTVTLSVKDINDCINTVTKAGKVHVFSPKANFKYSSSKACADSTLTFIDLSTTADGTNNIIKWKWKYGDNKIDSFAAPLPAPITHSYSTEGTYFPKLIVIDAIGCIDSVTYATPLTISKPVAHIFVDKPKTCNNDVLTFSALTSTGNNLTYKWDFGDGTYDNVLRPKKSYTSNGSYDVKLVVTDLDGCTSTAFTRGLIEVKEIKAGFTASSTYGTCIPFPVRFTDTSLNETSRFWDFGDGNTGSPVLPVSDRTYVSSDTFHVKLIVSRGTEGVPTRCVDTASLNIIVNAPTATLTYTPLEGCSPLPVKFSASSASQLIYTLDFGDGNASNPSSTVDTAYIYTYANNFTPKLVIEDTSHCKITIVGKDVIKVYGTSVNFKADTTLVCDRGLVKFTNLSVSNGPIASYTWYFGDGTSSTSKDAEHTYQTTGYYAVKLIIRTVYGCNDSLVRNAYIRVAKKPSITIDALSDSCGPSTATFKGILLDSDGSPLIWNWNFGNGNGSDLQNPPDQKYTNIATYLVTLIGKSPSGCSDTANININIHPIPTVFAGNDTIICLNTPAQLFATGADSFTWQPIANLTCINCNNPIANPTDNITYKVTGTTIFNCSSTDEIFIEVKKPFSLSGLKPFDSVCLGKSIQLKVTGAENYSWSPADGLNNTNTASVAASPLTNTTYMVSGYDSKNCFRDSAFIDLKVNPNPTVNAGEDMVLHLGNSVPLSIQYSSDVNGWLWSPAVGLSCSTCPAPIATPETSTTYTITVSNQSKCSASDEVFIKVVCDNSNLFLPTAFTPNGDGLNDVFYPMGIGLFKIQSLRIFNRYGQVVFEKSNFNANDRSAGWDGRFKGKTSDPAAYVYTLEVICKNNQVLTINGKILLIQ